MLTLRQCAATHSTGFYHNPLIEPTQRIPLGSVFTFDSIVPRQELARTAIYNEFFVPAGMEERLGVRLLAEGSFTALVNLYRHGHKGAFDRADAELLASLVAHLQRALQLNVRLADLEISRITSTEILDRLSQASLLVDAACRVLFANRAAEDILVEGCGLSRSGDGTLRTDRQIETFYMHKFVASAAGRITDGKIGAGGRIRLSRGEERTPLIVLVIPLRTTTEWLAPRRPAAILFVTDPERANAPTAANLQHSFGLTRTEAAVALQVLHGKGLQAAAAALHIAPVTARSHLAAIFAKTHTSRQAELVRVLLQSDGGIRSE